MKRESKLEVSFGSLHSEISEAPRRGVGKIVGVSRDGGHKENMTYNIN